MTRDPPIQRIADEARDDCHQQRDEFPARPEVAQDAHDGIGIRVTLLAFEQQERQRIDWIDAVLSQQVAAARCLHGRELIPRVPIMAFTPDPTTFQRLAFMWGARPQLVPFVNSLEEMIDHVDKALMRSDVVQVGDQVVLVCGFPV